MRSRYLNVDREGWALSAQNSMERTRGIFRRPVVWIVLVIIAAIALSSLFTGGQDYHSLREWASVQDMAAAAATAVELIRLWGEDARLRRSS